MYAGWNLVVTLILTSLYGQSFGFWPFNVLASKDNPDTIHDSAKGRRIAIIGKFTILRSDILFSRSSLW